MSWSDSDSETFLDLARYAVPEREGQIDLFCRLLPPMTGACRILDVGCGEGLLSEALLERFPEARVVGLDGSPRMLRRATERTAAFEDRFTAEPFALEDRGWRRRAEPVHAVVSSLVIHHLHAGGKRALFRDLFDLLNNIFWMSGIKNGEKRKYFPILYIRNSFRKVPNLKELLKGCYLI